MTVLFFHITSGQRIHISRPPAGERCGATIFYAICETRVITKNVGLATICSLHYTFLGSLAPLKVWFFHITFDQRIHKSRPRPGEGCGATIFYAICDTRVMTKNIATVLPKWA